MFRATEDAERFQLDLGAPLDVAAVRLDGEDVAYDHARQGPRRPGAGDRATAATRWWCGTPARPKPVAAPTTRTDFSTLGWTITHDGETWTMQEPFGAYSWYAVNDQPSDKALYDFTITAPAPLVGVANGDAGVAADRRTAPPSPGGTSTSPRRRTSSRWRSGTSRRPGTGRRAACR